MQIISIKMENRSNGPGRAADDLWDSWKFLDKGSFMESEEIFTLTNLKGETFIASKTGELTAAKIYNRFISTDLNLFDVYEGQNPNGGYFILYRFKDEKRRKEFVISTIMGVGGGSSINFEIDESIIFDNPLPELIPYRKGNKWGFCTSNKEIVIECKYDSIGRFSEGLAKVKISGKWGFIDKHGVIKITHVYDEAIKYYGGLAGIMFNGKWGFIDKNGIEKIPCIYEDAMVSANLAAVKLNNKWGFFDKNGTEIIPCIYDNIKFLEDLGTITDRGWNVQIDGGWYCIDRNGNKINYDSVAPFVEGLMARTDGHKWGFIDETLKLVINCIYDDVNDFSEGLATVNLNGKWGFIDKCGTVIVSCIYDRTYSFLEEIGVVKLNNKYGFVDKAGKIIIPIIYDDVRKFTEGLANVKLSKKWFYIDKNGTQFWEE